MKNFWKHVLRSGKDNLGTLLGAACIIGLGIFVYVAMMDTLTNLKDQVDSYYENSQMADVFATVEGISAAELEQLKEIPGIAGAGGKMAEDVRMLAAGQTEIVTVHLLSYSEEGLINRMRLSGAGTRENGFYLGSKMMADSGYEAGAQMTLLINGTGKNFVLEGVCHAPEYIYTIPPGGTMIPDGEIYDIACMELGKMEEFTGRKDSFNELGFRLEPGYTYDDVRYQLSDRLSGNGLTALCEREKQASYDMVAGEMGELISLGTLLPAMFLSISVFMLFVVLKKMIDKDQSVIGTMKAMGMLDRELITAYMMQGIGVGLAGAVLGGIVAIPFGRYMFGIYARFFNLPVMEYHSYIGSRLQGVGLSVGISVISVYLGVRGILEITPAQAMRARTPKSAVSIRIPEVLLTKLGPMEKMACRSISRNFFRGCLIVLAIGFPFAMSSVLFSFDQVADQMFFNQFTKIQTYDMQISLSRYVSRLQAENAAMELTGVAETEAIIQMAVELQHDNRSEFTMLYGLNQGSGMWRVMDLYGTYYEPPDDGVILNSRTADKLHLKAGDTVLVSCTGITAEAVKIPVAAVIEESLGSGCYISGKGFEHYLGTNSIAGTVLLKVRPGQLKPVREQLLDTGRVIWLVDSKRILRGYEDQMVSMLTMVNMFALMSVIAGGILIYNISMINIRERTTEFGTIMLMGGSGRDIGRILVFEYILYFIMGILAGIPGSLGVKMLVEQVILSDSYSMNLVVERKAYAASFVICLVIAAITCLVQMRVIRAIEIVEVLKERE